MKQIFFFLICTFSLGMAQAGQPSGVCDALSIQIKSLNLSAPYDLAPKVVYWGQALQVTAIGEFRNYIWRTGGPAIFDFDEQISNLTTVGHGFQVKERISDIQGADSFRLYWKPTSSGQQVSRTLRLRAQPKDSNEWCEKKMEVQLRPFVAPTLLYTADHRAAEERLAEKGRVIDHHVPWHFFHMLHDVELNSHPSFLHWHHLYVDRYKRWRNLFKYRALKPWQPGMPITPAEIYLSTEEYPVNINPADWPISLPDQFPQFEETIMQFHNIVHANLQTCQASDFGCFRGLSSPKSELFWRFHLALDNAYTHFCKAHQANCPQTGNQ